MRKRTGTTEVAGADIPSFLRREKTRESDNYNLQGRIVAVCRNILFKKWKLRRNLQAFFSEFYQTEAD